MKLRHAMVCSSNQNRSMEAHALLKREGFDVASYGTGQHVKLPGPSLREPNVYDFGTPYNQMFDELRRIDPEFYEMKFEFIMKFPHRSEGFPWQSSSPIELLADKYSHVGIVNCFTFVDRHLQTVQELVESWNRKVKYRRNGILPMLKRNLSVKTAPQRWQENAADGTFDVVLTFEEKVFDMVLEDLHNRGQVLMKPILVINLEVKDNHEEAAIGGRLALQLCQEIEASEDWEECLDDIIINFERQNHRKLVYSISYY